MSHNLGVTMAFYRCTFYPWQPYMVARQGTSRCRACPVGCAPRGTWSRSDRLPGPDVGPWCSYIYIYKSIFMYLYLYIYIWCYIYICSWPCSWCFRNPIPIISDHPIPYPWNVWPILMNIYESHMNDNNETSWSYQPLSTTQGLHPSKEHGMKKHQRLTESQQANDQNSFLDAHCNACNSCFALNFWQCICIPWKSPELPSHLLHL